jgi:guanidinopropionase
MHRELHIDPFEKLRVSDLGDVPMPRILNPDLVEEDAETFYRQIDERGIIPITVGGDHSITNPIIRSIAGKTSRLGGPVAVIHFDSHADSWAPALGTAYHAGVVFRFGVEENLIDPSRSLQIGFNGPLAAFEQDDFSRQHYTLITLQDFIERGVDWVASEVHRIVGSGPVYVSLDLDVLDLAYAPAVADPEVGGLTSRELFSLLNKFRGLNIVGADIACFCPPLDSPGQITALTASEILLQYVALIADFRTRFGAPTAEQAMTTT